MITIGTDPAPETFNDEKAHRAMIARHSKSVADAIKDLYPIVWADTVTSTISSLFTTIAAPGVVTTDLVFVSARNGVGAQMIFTSPGVIGAVGQADQVIIGHPNQLTTGEFNVMVVRP